MSNDSLTADIETSTDDYATRFAGPTGEWMLNMQVHTTLQIMAKYPGASVLDVGGGHGQHAIPLCARGYPVTVLSSAESCRKRIAAIVDSGQCKFVVGEVVKLPFPAKSFDVAISFRLVTHCPLWPTLIQELCRVARQAVIVDYPTSQSINAIAPALFNTKKKIEKNVRTWTLFKHAQIIAAFAQQGYEPRVIKKQFFLPMVLHRALKTRWLSAGMEHACRIVGLTAKWGSPVIVEMVPAAPTGGS